MQRPRLLIEQLKYFSLFSGVGGFELGIQQAHLRWGNRETQIKEPISSIKSMEACKQNICKLGDNAFSNSRPTPICIGFSEIDKYATQIYKTHFPTHKEYGNVSAINWSDTENFDLLVGGFPCQAFSIAGKRQGFDDTRGTLFFEIARCLKEKHPRLLLLENVKGLLSHDKGRTFGVILNTLDELGYDLQWQVLNSKNFDVPQNRERVFIIGHLRGTSRPEVFPIRQGNRLDTPAQQKNGKEIQTHRCLEATEYKNYSSERFDGVLQNIRTNQPNPRPEGDKSDNPNSIGRATYSDDMRIRRLTPTECERLQGFPDGWTEGISDTQRYKCLGNAVTVNVIETVMSKLVAQ